MATLELEKTQVTNEELAAERHNAMIGECYRRLENALDYQFPNENQTVRASAFAPVAPTPVAPVAPISATPAVEQRPQITEYVPKRMETPVFTTEKFQAVQDVATPIAPTQAVAPVELYAPTAVKAPEYMFTNTCKTVLAVFTAVVTAMLTLICVNSSVIKQKTLNIQNLEQRKQQLIEENEELQRRLEIAQSDETIEEYAKSQGMILGK